ncbi:aspartic peptidase A1 [Schizopora paradoxa]|uniref:Aspartic peptidase A1 n=1 Tax=Schizopora paradoxa TaxID=27342 RepID=A0A0H2S0D0_9AGAM|nr:aspartic peptidase A1 [Schizopora paradoxa]
MRTSTFISTLSFVLAVAAGPIVVRDNLISLPLSKKINVTEPGQLLKQDQARAAILRSLGFASGNATAKSELLGRATPGSTSVTNQAVSYIATVEVGTPPSSYSLIVDTGSSNTWVGAETGRAYNVTSSSHFTGNAVEVTYGSGRFVGLEYTDTVSLGTGLTISKQSIGAASFSEGFNGVDGILGLGPVDLTVGTLFPSVTSTIPTVTDNLFSQGDIPADEVAISFEPTTSLNNVNGELTFGGTDSTKFTGAITYAPITMTSTASKYWGIDQSIRYGASTNILSTTAGIVDTGTTLIMIASDAFAAYQAATGGVMDSATGLLKIDVAQFGALQSLFFNIGGTTFELTANAQIWPRALNTNIGGAADGIYLIVGSTGSPSGSGLDFINGMTFLERFYSVFDTANKRVGIANTPFTDATTN